MMAASMSGSASLKEYLKKYESAGEEQQKKKKKRKKPAKPPAAGGVLIVDEDPVWAKPVIPEAEEEESAGEETPVIDEDIEVKRLRRLELLRSRKPYHAISEDGSGWVSVSDRPRDLRASAEASDLSPPRQRRSRLDSPSPSRSELRSSDAGGGDLSPPRQRQRRYGSPSPEGDKELPSDLSPPRKETSRGSDEDLSPPRRRRQGLTEDLSPPRRERKNSVKDLSPPRRGRKDLVGDLSPRRRGRVDLSEDLSPPRRGRKALQKDISPPRRGREGSSQDLSPPRRGTEGSSQDLSFSRKVNKSLSVNLSPPTQSCHSFPEANKSIGSAELDLSPPRRRKRDTIKDLSPPRFAARGPALSGKGAEGVYRDKEGKALSKEELLRMQKTEEKPKEKKLEWGKGLSQKREAEAIALELELEKEKPFARSRDDPELDTMLRKIHRWGDPMAHLIKKKHSEPILEDFGVNEKMKDSGFIIPQTIPNHSWLKRGIDPPPNRYGIRPGRHWDGVDRSNGYEKEMFKRHNERKATETDAYLWSVSEM